MADSACDQFTGAVRAVGADHAAAGPAPGPGRHAGAQSADRLVPGAPVAHRPRPASDAGCKRMMKSRPAAELLLTLTAAATAMQPTPAAAPSAARILHYAFITQIPLAGDGGWDYLSIDA